MSLFCKKCGNRRLPKWMKQENITLWLCANCRNYADGADYIIREME